MKFKTKVNVIVNYVNDLFTSIYSESFTVPLNSIKIDSSTNLLLDNFTSLNFESLAASTKIARDLLHANLLNKQNLSTHNC